MIERIGISVALTLLLMSYISPSTEARSSSSSSSSKSTSSSVTKSSPTTSSNKSSYTGTSSSGIGRSKSNMSTTDTPKKSTYFSNSDKSAPSNYNSSGIARSNVPTSKPAITTIKPSNTTIVSKTYTHPSVNPSLPITTRYVTSFDYARPVTVPVIVNVGHTGSVLVPTSYFPPTTSVTYVDNDVDYGIGDFLSGLVVVIVVSCVVLVVIAAFRS